MMVLVASTKQTRLRTIMDRFIMARCSSMSVESLYETINIAIYRERYERFTRSRRAASILDVDGHTTPEGYHRPSLQSIDTGNRRALHDACMGCLLVYSLSSSLPLASLRPFFRKRPCSQHRYIFSFR